MKKRPRYSDNIIDLYVNHNHCWFTEIKKRARKYPNDPYLKFRGVTITYAEYIKKCEEIWAPSLKAKRIGKDTEIVLCMDSTPEFCYLFGAASIVGAHVHIVSDEFDKNYLFDIFNKSNSEYVFVSSTKFSGLKLTLKRLSEETEKKVISIPTNYSLEGKSFLEDFIKTFEPDCQQQENAKQGINNIVGIEDFLEDGKNYNGEIYAQSSLNDVFTTTYSSGTTDGNRPKGIDHLLRHYIIMGKYHDSEVSGIPNLKNATTYSNIPNHSNSFVASILSDTAMEGGCIALDTILTKEYFIYGLLINKPNMAIATTSTWLYTAKMYYRLPEEKRKKITFPSTIFPVAVGEPMSPGEEQFLNKFVRDAKMGTKLTKYPVSVMSICGGDCEHGSILIRVLRKYADLFKKPKEIKEPIGLQTYDFVKIVALRPDGSHCQPNEPGRLVAKSLCTMKGYHNEPERTERFFVNDCFGTKWGDMGCYGYLDKNDNVYMKGRIVNSEDCPEFRINDVIQMDIANILSSSVVKDENENYIAYIDLQPFSQVSQEFIYESVARRCLAIIGSEILEKLYIKILAPNEQFPLTSCLKRDLSVLRNYNTIKKASPVQASSVLNGFGKQKEYSPKSQVSVKAPCA